MYGYINYIPLNIEEIYKRISQEDIFKLYFDEIILDKQKVYKAPYREDNNPDCYFEYYNNTLYFIDFADIGIKSKNAISFVSRMENFNYIETLNFINKKFKLGLNSTLENPKKVVHEIQTNYEKPVKIYKDITYIPRNFEKRDMLYWSGYKITKQQLIEDKIIPIEAYRGYNRKGKPFVVRPFDLMYAFTDFENKKVKIYRPNLDGNGKWFTNLNNNDIGGIKYLIEPIDNLVITKSYKDFRVLKNMKLNVIWFQNEGMLPNNKILITVLNLVKKRVYVWFDNDATGLANGKQVTDTLNTLKIVKAKQIFLPPKLLKEGVKDPSDLIFKKLNGEELLETFIKSNII